MTNFLKELKRRKVWLFGGVYLAAGWILMQVAIALEASLELPKWFDQIAVLMLALGFPVALVLAWAKESEPASEGAVEERDRETRPSFSIAILPFDNLTNDTAREGLASGLSEDIITLLHGYPGLRIAARNTSFQFQGQAVDIRTAGETFNVCYVLEGSLRLVGSSMRITAQLIETRSGEHVWADRYDVPLETIETAQDKITERISSSLGDVTMRREIQRLRREPIETLTAHELSNIGDYLIWRGDEKNPGEAIKFLQAAVGKQPDSAMAHAYLAYALPVLSNSGVGDRQEYNAKSRKAAHKALTLAPNDSTVLACVANAYRLILDRDKAMAYARQAVALGPKEPRARIVRAMMLSAFGDQDAALEDWNIVLDLISAGSTFYSYALGGKARTLFSQNHHEEAAAFARKSILDKELHAVFLLLIAATGHLERSEEAANLIKDFLTTWPKATVAALVYHIQNNFLCDESYPEQLVSGLRKAGMDDSYFKSSGNM